MTENTDDLLDNLINAEEPKELIEHLDMLKKQGITDLRSYLTSFLEQKGMSVADLQRKSYIDRTYIYQIMDGTRKPGRDKVIAIALALKMNIDEIQRALKIAGTGILYSKNRRDSIIIYAVGKEMTVTALNSLLEEYGEDVLS